MMFDRFLAPLLEMLRAHFDLSKTRLETLAEAKGRKPAVWHAVG